MLATMIMVSVLSSQCCAQRHQAGQEMDKAGEEHCKLLIFLRSVFFQAAPFWQEAWPDMALWRHPLFQSFREPFAKWAKVQCTFCQQMQRTAEQMRQCGCYPIGFAPAVQLGNAAIRNVVSLAALSLFFTCMAIW